MTRKEHLQKLPLKKRLQAMENLRKSPLGLSRSLGNKCSTHGVLIGGFDMQNNRQGWNYWYGIHIKYFV